MAGKRDKKGSKGGVIVKKYEIVEGGHHGGAWKVAYADFVTAMMAFFLLMWLLNATTEDQRKGLADYFSPNNLMSHASSGTGQPFGGHTAFDEGALVSDRGAVQIVTGKRPVIERTEDGDDPVYTDTHQRQIRRRPRRGTDGRGSGRRRHIRRQAPRAEGHAAGARPRRPVRRRPRRPAGRTGSITAGELAAEKAREEKAAFEQAAQQIKAGGASRSGAGGSRQTAHHRHDPGRAAHPDPR